MPLPPVERNTSKLPAQSETHPYIIKMEIKLTKMRQIMNNIFEIADSNLIITDAKSSLNDYTMNHAFADKLDNISKEVIGLSKCLTEKAAAIRTRVDRALDEKRRFEDVTFIRHVTNQMKKCDLAKEQDPQKIREFKLSEDYPIPRETLDSSDSDDDQTDGKEQQLGEPDGHFMYAKTNENDPMVHSFMCKHCQQTFRDRNELRNHSTHHKMEFYRCLLCAKIFRSIRSFESHQKTHSVRYTCTVCHNTFELKSSLKNHMAVHSTELETCSHKGCTKQFKHRGNFLEHVNWSHRKTKDVPCTSCNKYFQTPSSMRAHRIHKHGYVPELVPGHPLAHTINNKRKATTDANTTATKKPRT